MSRASLISIVDNKSHRIELILFKRDMITEAQALRAKSIEIEKNSKFHEIDRFDHFKKKLNSQKRRNQISQQQI